MSSKKSHSSLEWDFFYTIQIAENRIYDFHLNIESNIDFLAILSKNKKKSHFVMKWDFLINFLMTTSVSRKLSTFNYLFPFSKSATN